MSDAYHYVADVVTQVEEIPADSIVSRTLFSDGPLRVIRFAFAAGQELSEHTAAVPAIIQILAGKGQVQVGEDVYEAQPGVWIHMQARLPHSVHAQTELTMLLTLLPKQE